MPTKNGNSTGRAQFLLIIPTTATRSRRLDFSGGPDQVRASNINKTYDEKNYFATYFQDDWKVNPKLTLNLGLRWDYFGPIQESNGGQANFVPAGAPDNKPEYHHPRERQRQSHAYPPASRIVGEGWNHPPPDRQVRSRDW